MLAWDLEGTSLVIWPTRIVRLLFLRGVLPFQILVVPLRFLSSVLFAKEGSDCVLLLRGQRLENLLQRRNILWEMYPFHLLLLLTELGLAVVLTSEAREFQKVCGATGPRRLTPPDH